MEKNSIEKLRDLMLKKYRKEISFEQLQKKFLKNDNERIEYIKTELEKAYVEKNEKNVNILVLAIFIFNLYCEDFIDMLCKLSKEEWHERHEDIAIYFMEMKLPSTVECLYELAISDFEKYRDDEYCQLVEKCCYALGAIGTEEAKEKLRLLLKSDKDIIQEHVEDTFEMYKLSQCVSEIIKIIKTNFFKMGL